MLTTNDLRVCELLAEGGRWTVSDLRHRLRRTNAGADPALLRLPGLTMRGLVVDELDVIGGAELRLYSLSPDGITEVRRAHRTAYGRAA